MSKLIHKPRLWIISELFYPEESSTSHLLTQIAMTVAEYTDVHVICGPELYENTTTRKENKIICEKIFIHRISFFKFNKNILWQRILKSIGLTILLCFSFIRRVKRKEKVLIVTNPATLLVFISWISKIKKCRLIVLVHDVFPENAIPAKIIKNETSLLYRLLKRIFDKAYARADTLIAIGRDMAEVLENKIKRFAGKNKPTIDIITNWCDDNNDDSISPSIIKCKEWEGKYVFLFAGNIGRVQGLDKLSEIISKVENPLIHFVFFGNGAYKRSLKEKIGSLKNVTIGDGFPRNQQYLLLNSCHVAIVSLAPLMYGLGVPSKFYNILATGKPVLYIGDSLSEIDRCINEYEIGWSFHEYGGELLSFFNNFGIDELKIADEMGKRSYRCAQELFSKSIVISKFRKVI